MKHLLLNSSALRLISELSSRGMTLATAESCTGGLVGAAVTSVPGSSAIFAGGVIAYSNEAKTATLGVLQETLKQRGAVSEDVALQMAKGARRVFGASLAVSTTGIAGPGGGSDPKPVGTVWVAVSGPSGARARLFQLKGNRQEIRDQTVDLALQEVLAYTGVDSGQ